MKKLLIKNLIFLALSSLSYLTFPNSQINYRTYFNENKEIMKAKLIHKPFYFMRHGATENNMHQICQGQLDIPLNEIGIQEAQNAVIENDEITNVFYSPLQRAAETARIATRNLTCPKTLLNDLQERNFGDWQGKKWTLSPKEKETQFTTMAPKNGEDWQQFSTRIYNVINFALEQSDVPLFVAHAGVFFAIREALEID